MKFYSVDEYAKIQNKTPQTIREWCQSRKVKSVSIMSTLSKLILEENTTSPNIISLVNMKGGCAKTTTAVHLAVLLAKLKFKVLLVDTDHQNQCELFFPQQEYSRDIAHILRGEKINQCIHTIPEHNMDIVFSSYDVAVIAPTLSSQEWLNKVIEPIRPNYDFIIFDTSPNFDFIVRGVISASSHIVIPVVPVTQHISGLNHNLKALRQAKIPVDKIAGILPTIVKPRLAQHNYFIDELKKEHDDLIFDSAIPEDGHLLNAAASRTNIFDYREKSNASRALKKFTWELLQRL